MTNEPDERFDEATLPPVQYLIMETLAARARLGEQVWTFPTKIGRGQFDKLVEHGLIEWKSAVIYGYVLAWLTPRGKASVLSADYVPPIDREADE